MLDANLKTQLKAYLEKVSQPFEIVASSMTATNPASCWACCKTSSA